MWKKAIVWKSRIEFKAHHCHHIGTSLVHPQDCRDFCIMQSCGRDLLVIKRSSKLSIFGIHGTPRRLILFQFCWLARSLWTGRIVVI